MEKKQMKWITLDWLVQPRHADKALSETHQPSKAQVCGVFICYVFRGVQIHHCCSRQACSQSYIHGMVGWCYCYLRPHTGAVFCHVCRIENHLHWVCVVMGGTSETDNRMKVCLLSWTQWKTFALKPSNTWSKHKVRWRQSAKCAR